MNNTHHEIILSLYKKKVQNIDIKAEVEEYHHSALVELDRLVINTMPTEEQEQYINELNTLLYEYF